MPDTATQSTSNDVAAVRAALMQDLATVPVVAEAMNKSPRTIQRMIARGELEIVMIGRTPHVVVSRTRERLVAAPTIRHAPVRRARPSSKKAAA
jgi:hypothetical protein